MVECNCHPQKRKILQPDAVEKRGKLQEALCIHSWRYTALTGMRRGEVYGLQWKDLDDNVVCINKFNEQTTGKNDNAQREVGLSDAAMQTLATGDAGRDEHPHEVDFPRRMGRTRRPEQSL